MAAPQIVARTTVYGPFLPGEPRVLLSTAGSATFAIWSEEVSGRAQVRVASLATGRIVDLPSSGGTDMLGPAVASAGDEILVVWYEQTRTGTVRYAGARILADGTLADARPFVIGSGASIVAPQVAWNGREFIVAWSITGTAVAHDGTSTAPVMLTSGQYSKYGRVDLGGGGESALAIAQGLFRPGTCGFGSCAPPDGPELESTVLTSGTATRVPTPVGPPSATGQPVAIGPAAEGLVVAWHDGATLWSARISPAAGTYTAPTPATNVPPFSLRQFTVANELVAWSTSAGVVESTIGPISAAGETASSPSVVWFGANRYGVAYVVENGAASRLELVTIDSGTRRRVGRH